MCGNTCRNLLDESGLRHGHFNEACCSFRFCLLRHRCSRCSLKLAVQQFIRLEMRSTKEKYFDWKMRLGAERSCAEQVKTNKQTRTMLPIPTLLPRQHNYATSHHSSRIINRIMFNLNIIIISMYAPVFVTRIEIGAALLLLLLPPLPPALRLFRQFRLILMLFPIQLSKQYSHRPYQTFSHLVLWYASAFFLFIFRSASRQSAICSLYMATCECIYLVSGCLLEFILCDMCSCSLALFHAFVLPLTTARSRLEIYYT